jgi:putative lipoprotein
MQPQPGLPVNPQQRRNRWRLGVYSTDTDTGVKVVEVVPNSPAHRVGLEPNDTIITVNGFQVGFVGGEHFDTGSEFDRLADDDGNVVLLVRNQRNGQLVNVPIQLESRFSSLQGTIGYRERLQLPQDAVCTVELREITRANAPPITLAQKTVAIRQIPIPFRLEYDPADIVARRNYYVHATITSGNRQLYTTNQDYQVLNGTNQAVAITLDPVVQTGTQVSSREEQLAEILRLYQDYLQRDPRQAEYDVLSSRLDRGQTIRDVQIDLLSGNEYWSRCEADDQLFVNQLHEQFFDRPAQQREMEYWLSRMDHHGGLRRAVTLEFLQAVGAPQS